MAQSLPTIAVLSASPALASILGATLRRERHWRIREFRDARALGAYARIAPVAIIVSDYELGEATAADIVGGLRNDQFVVSRDVQVIALSRSIDGALRERCIQAGIDEVLAKPMSPLYLEERIRARLSAGPRRHIATEGTYAGPERRQRTAMTDRRPTIERRSGNIVSLKDFKAQRNTPRPGTEPVQ